MFIVKFTIFRIPKDGPGTVYHLQAPPVRFFPEGSVVTDFYSGELSSAFEHLLNHDFIFVMYYAPWSTASQNARYEFDLSAQSMHTRVN